MMQTAVKRLVAYSSVSHLGFVVLGTFAFTLQAMTGGVLQMVNHGLSTGALFLLVGMVYERTHTRNLSEMGGLAAGMPWLMGAFLFVSLSSLGLPGLNNFIGEFLVILGTVARHRAVGAIAAIGVVRANVPRSTRNAPMKLFSPGRPKEDSETNRNAPISQGIPAARPPISERFRVWVRS